MGISSGIDADVAGIHHMQSKYWMPIHLTTPSKIGKTKILSFILIFS